MRRKCNSTHLRWGATAVEAAIVVLDPSPSGISVASASTIIANINLASLVNQLPLSSALSSLGLGGLLKACCFMSPIQQHTTPPPARVTHRTTITPNPSACWAASSPASCSPRSYQDRASPDSAMRAAPSTGCSSTSAAVTAAPLC